MNEREKDFLKIVNEDIQELRKIFSGNRVIKDSEIRSSSVVLRRMLINEEFYNAWKIIQLESQPKIQFEELSNLVDISRKSEIAIAVCGGAKYNGAEVKGFSHVRYAKTAAERKGGVKNKSKNIAKNTKGFINSLCCIVDGQEVTRREVVQYFANNCGGAHYDMKLDEKMNSLFDVNKQMKILDMSIVNFEFISIAQNFLFSKDTDRLLKKICYELKKS